MPSQTLLSRIERIRDNDAECLYLSPDQYLNSESEDLLHNAIKQNTVLEGLYFNQTRGGSISLRGVQLLARGLSQSPRSALKYLHLDGISVGGQGAIAISHWLHVCRPCFEELHLLSAGIDANGTKAIAQTIQMNPRIRIRSLDLSGNPIGNDGALAIAKLLVHNRTLNRLDLSDTSIGEVGTRALAVVVEHNRQCNLTDLRMRTTACFGDETLEAVASMLEHNSKLEIVHLSGSEPNITAHQAIFLARAIQGNPNSRLRVLGIRVFGKKFDAVATAFRIAAEKQGCLESISSSFSDPLATANLPREQDSGTNAGDPFIALGVILRQHKVRRGLRRHISGYWNRGMEAIAFQYPAICAQILSKAGKEHPAIAYHCLHRLIPELAGSLDE